MPLASIENEVVETDFCQRYFIIIKVLLKYLVLRKVQKEYIFTILFPFSAVTVIPGESLSFSFSLIFL